MLTVALVNGNIITVEEDQPTAEAVGITGNCISFVGTHKDIQEKIGRETEVIDLKGRTLMPGMIDSHYHPILGGLIQVGIDSAIINTFKENCPSIGRLLEMIRQAAKSKKPGEWISMMGYEPSYLAGGRHPTIEELDRAAPHNPVHCMHGGGHICMYNSLALQHLGIYEGEDAKKFPKDEVEVVDGRLTGMVRGHTHFFLWSKVHYSRRAQTEAAMSSQRHCLENGITSIHDCGELGKTSYHIMQKLCRNGEFRVRSYMMIHSIFGKPFSKAENDHWMALGLMSGLGDERFKIGSSKFMIDGGSGGPSCLTRKPYSHDPNLPREKGWERAEVAAYLKEINDAECQATAHAIGDGAVEYMVEGYEKAFATDPRPDLRHRIEHCTLADRDLIMRMSRMNICPSVNVGQITFQGANYMRFYGPERNKYLCALRTMLDSGIKCSLQSDYPSGPAGLALLDGAVNRYDRVNGVQCDETQKISLMEAIRCATLYGAYASYEEDKKGSIKVGKLADIIVLSEDITAMDPMDLDRVKVDMTFIDGILEYERRREQ
ncbi:MAG: amidohydrolase [Anaerovoracaceae bacterium]|jgi:predicted amidohydrolase YtcJ